MTGLYIQQLYNATIGARIITLAILMVTNWLFYDSTYDLSKQSQIQGQADARF